MWAFSLGWTNPLMAGDATAARQVCHRRLAELTAATNARVLDLGSGGGLGRLKPGGD
jgi:hypothetical protein